MLELESINFAGKMINITVKQCTWVIASGLFFSFVRVIALDLVYICNFQLA
jgi:hypothetical protein